MHLLIAGMVMIWRIVVERVSIQSAIDTATPKEVPRVHAFDITDVRQFIDIGIFVSFITQHIVAFEPIANKETDSMGAPSFE